MIGSGFMQRNLLFRKDNDKTKEYRPEGATFIGRLHHDLIACETGKCTIIIIVLYLYFLIKVVNLCFLGLPPGTKLVIELERSKHEFVLMKKLSDTEQYKLKILEIAILMPVAQLTQSVYNEFQSLMTTTYKNKPVGISHRKIEIRPLNIPVSSRNFHSELLFSEDMPARIVICFIEQKRKGGDYRLVKYYSILI